MAGALEVHAAGLDDALIPGLSFTNRNTASYVTSRRSTSFQPVSGGVFSPSNLRIIRFNIQDTDGQFLDGSTLRLALVLSNTGTHALQPACHAPSAMFSRLRLLAGGVEITDIASFGRTQQMFENFTSAERRRENYIEGCGSVLPTSADSITHMLISDYTQSATLKVGKKRRMLTQLLCPFLNNGKLIPISLCGGLVLELELGGLDDAFSYATGTNWEIQQPEILVDVCGIDPSVSSSYASHLLSGKTLPITYGNIFTMQTSLSSTTAVSIPISRGFSRLNSVYITFLTTREVPGATPTACHPVADFFCPLLGEQGTTDLDTFQASYQLGSVKGPSVQYSLDRRIILPLAKNFDDGRWVRSYGNYIFRLYLQQVLLSLQFRKGHGIRRRAYRSQHARGTTALSAAAELRRCGNSVYHMFVRLLSLNHERREQTRLLRNRIFARFQKWKSNPPRISAKSPRTP